MNFQAHMPKTKNDIIVTRWKPTLKTVYPADSSHHKYYGPAKQQDIKPPSKNKPSNKN